MPTRRTWATVVGGFHLALGLCFILVLRWIQTAEAAPVWWHYAALAVAQLALSGPLLRHAHRRIAIAMSAGFFLIVAVGFSVPWTARDRFLIDFEHIAPGMKRSEVAEIMSGYEPGHERQVKIRDENTETFRPTEDGTENLDLGVVRYEADRVVSVEFSPW